MRRPISPDIQLTRLSIHPIGYEPNSNVHQNISHIMARNIGNPNSLLVTNVSIIFVVFSSFTMLPSMVSASAPWMKPYLSADMVEAISSFSLADTLF